MRWASRFLKPTCPMASDSTQQMSKVVKLERALLAPEVKTDCCTLTCFNYIFFGILIVMFFNFQKFGGGDRAPCPSPCYGPVIRYLALVYAYEIQYYTQSVSHLYRCHLRCIVTGICKHDFNASFI